MDQDRSLLYRLTKPLGGIVLNLADFADKAKTYGVKEVTLSLNRGVYPPLIDRQVHEGFWVTLESKEIRTQLNAYEQFYERKAEPDLNSQAASEAYHASLKRMRVLSAMLQSAGLTVEFKDNSHELRSIEDRLLYFGLQMF